MRPCRRASDLFICLVAASISIPGLNHLSRGVRTDEQLLRCDTTTTHAIFLFSAFPRRTSRNPLMIWKASCVLCRLSLLSGSPFKNQREDLVQVEELFVSYKEWSVNGKWKEINEFMLPRERVMRGVEFCSVAGAGNCSPSKYASQIWFTSLSDLFCSGCCGQTTDEPQVQLWGCRCFWILPDVSHVLT